jgi:hypothetical protein
LALGGCPQPAQIAPRPPSGASFVLAPEQVHYGATYAQWSQRWWQWVFELPLTNHPLYDRTGADALQGQIDPVWFLGGVFSVNGSPVDPVAVRDVTIPSGIALFFPIINTSWSNYECSGIDTDWTFSYMRGLAAEQVENVTDLLCELDGRKIIDSPDLAGASRFRAQAPAFAIQLTADNILSDFCGFPQPPRVMDPVATDGIWMMIAPLPPGGHLLHFTGTFPTFGPGGFHLDVTYRITVLP